MGFGEWEMVSGKAMIDFKVKKLNGRQIFNWFK